MNGFLLDTNVISELIKPRPDGNVLRWIAETDEALLFCGSQPLAVNASRDPDPLC